MGNLIPCRVIGCAHEAKSRGLCSGHYRRWWLTRDVQASVPLRARIDDESVLEHHATGLSQKEIAQLVGCGQSVVSRILRKHGLGVGKGFWAPERLLFPDATEIRRMYLDEGMTQTEIAEAKGCSPTCVQRAMKRHGIPSRPAAKRDQRGEKNTSWSGGRREHQGYIRLAQPDHPLADKTGGVAEHVAVAYEKYGHAAPDGHVVHHVNMRSGDNRPENLVYVPKRLHHLLHRQFEQVVPILMERGILTFDLEHGYYVTGTEPKVLQWDEMRACAHCGEDFLVKTKRPTQRFCSQDCGRFGRVGMRYKTRDEPRRTRKVIV